MKYNLLNLDHYILNMLNHILFYLFIFSFIIIKFKKKTEKKEKKSYKDKDHFLCIQILSILNLKYKMLNSTKMGKYNSSIRQDLFQHTLNTHNYTLLIYFIMERGKK